MRRAANQNTMIASGNHTLILLALRAGAIQLNAPLSRFFLLSFLAGQEREAAGGRPAYATARVSFNKPILQVSVKSRNLSFLAFLGAVSLA